MTSPRQEAPPGLTVGGYQLLTRLGEGGMGVVHLAQRPDGHRVALKVLRPNIVGDDEARARLAREVSSLSRIKSHRIAEIVDADPWGDIPYVATRYVPGLSLHDEIQQDGAIEGADLLWFAGCLAEGLAAVHAVGVLHRDIKPSNVLMEGRTPILIDFGLARVADDPKLTHTGWLLGTPGYLAPEILHGEDATTASDVHSWAATLTYAGTGRAPFGRGPAMAIMDRVRRGEHRLEGLPDGLRELVAECLDPDPLQRPTLPEIREWLGAVPDPVGAEAPLTLPMAAAFLDDAEAPTTRQPSDHWLFDELDEAREPTKLLSDEESDETREWVVQGRPVERTPALERLRRFTVIMSGVALSGVAIAAAPWLALAAILVAAWLLRSGSLAGSAVGNRRTMRGRKWYDAPQLLLATPWHLLASIPGTVLLAIWSAGIAVAVALLCFAGGLDVTLSTGLVGAGFAASMWLGPGGSRVRSPLGRVVRPVSRRPAVWFCAVALLLASAGALTTYVMANGTTWIPWSEAPWTGINLPADPFAR